jgi:hypothetical protein
MNNLDMGLVMNTFVDVYLKKICNCVIINHIQQLKHLYRIDRYLLIYDKVSRLITRRCNRG